MVSRFFLLTSVVLCGCAGGPVPAPHCHHPRGVLVTSFDLKDVLIDEDLKCVARFCRPPGGEEDTRELPACPGLRPELGAIVSLHQAAVQPRDRWRGKVLDVAHGERVVHGARYHVLSRRGQAGVTEVAAWRQLYEIRDCYGGCSWTSLRFVDGPLPPLEQDELYVGFGPRRGDLTEARILGGAALEAAQRLKEARSRAPRGQNIVLIGGLRQERPRWELQVAIDLDGNGVVDAEKHTLRLESGRGVCDATRVRAPSGGWALSACGCRPAKP